MAQYSLRRLLQKKNRSISEWVLQENIQSEEDLETWKSHNGDFEIDEELKKEILETAKPKKTVKRKQAVEVVAEQEPAKVVLPEDPKN